MGSYRALEAKAAAPVKGGTYRKLDVGGAPASAKRDVVGALSTLARSIPLVDEVNDAIGANVKTAADLMTGKTSVKAGMNPVDAAKASIGDFKRNFQDLRGRSKASAASFAERRPRAAPLTQGVGMALTSVPALMTGGAAAAPAAAPAASGLMGTLQKVGSAVGKIPLVNRIPAEAMAKSGLMGALTGQLTGLTDEGSLEERLEAGNNAIVPSAVLGAALPPAVMASAGLLNAGRRAFTPAAERAAGQAGRVLAERAPGVRDMPDPDGLSLPFERMGPGGETVARAVASVPGPGQDIARRALMERRAGARGRIVNTLRRELGDDGTSFHGLKDALDKQRLEQSRPLYAEAFDRAPPVDDALERLKARPSVRKAMRRGADLAHEAGEDPNALGLFHMEDLADWVSETPPDARTAASVDRALRRRGPSRPASRGASLAKFIADGGGIRDRGDVAAMGGGDWHKGRAYQKGLIGEGGDADEWALRAWERGYFPQHQTRPTANELLDAIGEEFRGRPRYAREADPRVTDRLRQLDQAEELNYRGGLDDEIPSPDDYVGRPEPREGPVEGEALTWKAWDYVKRGLDDELEALRDPVTRKLPRTDEVRLIEQTRRDLRRILTGANPKYREALAAYTGPSRQMNAMDMGRRMVTGQADPEQLAEGMELMGRDEQDALRLGLSRGLSDVFRSRDPQKAFRRFIEDDIVQERLRLGFGDDEAYSRFMKDVADEFEANLSYNRILTGSRTTPLAEEIAAVNRAADDGGIADRALAAAGDGRPLKRQAFDWAVTKLRQAREASSGLNNPEVSRLLGQALFRAGDPEELLQAMVRQRIVSPEEVRAILPYLAAGEGQATATSQRNSR